MSILRKSRNPVEVLIIEVEVVQVKLPAEMLNQQEILKILLRVADLELMRLIITLEKMLDKMILDMRNNQKE